MLSAGLCKVETHAWIGLPGFIFVDQPVGILKRGSCYKLLRKSICLIRMAMHGEPVTNPVEAQQSSNY